MSIGLISVEVIQSLQLNDFVHLHIQREGIAMVVENYQPIRDEYYDAKYNSENQQKQRKENQDVQRTAIID